MEGRVSISAVAYPPVFFLPLLTMVFCAARVICTVPHQREAAMDTYLLMKHASDPGGVNDKDLTAAMHE